ncbi:MAG TPA: nucleotide sugar dehydrogenase [Pseudonocardiaceae bacterium]|nr:nucleotide sugar dehydrogenase [Pseudonocardiaceae bacterium]
MSVDVVIIGLGYVGLPLARAACTAGMVVAGYDISAEVVGNLTAGRSHVLDVSDADVRLMLAGEFRATRDPSVIAAADAVVICVPTGLSADGTPDLRAVCSAARQIAIHMRPGSLVVLESTSYPGTTEDVVRPILEDSGLTAGQDFHLAYSPERVDPGNHRFGIRNTPKVVGGYTPMCAKRCDAFYSRFVDTVVTARGPREAELAKLLENTYRCVNIALVNQVAVYCNQIEVDVWDVLRCAATKPFGFQQFTPGPGVGGHCIPVDPSYLAYQARTQGCEFDLIDAAQRINAEMPAHVVRRAQDILNGVAKPVRGSGVLLLGVGYKPDAADLRQSPAFGVARQLLDLGARLSYHDPYVRRFTVTDTVVPREHDLPAGLQRADLTILLQDHRCYDPGELAGTAQLLFDTRGKVLAEHVHRL